MDYLKIGFIKKPHGIKGEVKVLPFSEDISRFKKLKKIFAQINEQFIELKLKSLKTMNDEVIIHFEECNDRNKAEEFRNIYLYVERKNAIPLSEWEYYSQDIIGLKVFYKDKKIGTITNINNFGAQDVIDIEIISKKVISYPFHREFIEKIDITNNLLIINQYEGYFD